MVLEHPSYKTHLGSRVLEAKGENIGGTYNARYLYVLVHFYSILQCAKVTKSSDKFEGSIATSCFKMAE